VLVYKQFDLSDSNFVISSDDRYVGYRENIIYLIPMTPIGSIPDILFRSSFIIVTD